MMMKKPGEVMGYLAYGHPFLDGNGRTIMVVHTELAQRAGISIDWGATGKTEYLTALTKEIEKPGAGLLDAHLKPFIRKAVEAALLVGHLVGTRGLDGSEDKAEENRIFGKISDPEVQTRYQKQKLQRRKRRS